MPRIKVAQKSGEITVAHAGGEPRTYQVKDGHVNADDEHVAALLGAIPGSSVVAEAPPKSQTAATPPKES